MVSYDTLLRTFRAELREQEKYKRDMIIKLAKKLEEEKYPTHDINAKLVFDLAGFIGKSYISQVLEKKYKQLDKIHEKGKGKEEEATVMNTNDGQTVVNDPEIEKEREAKEQFTNEFNEALNKRVSESSSSNLNDAVLKELNKELDIRKNLEEKLAKSITHEQYQELENKVSVYSDIFENIEKNHLGEYVRFEKEDDGQLYVAEVLSTRDPHSLTVEIDLKKFGNKIKESFQHGNTVATIEIDNGKIKKWT